MRRSSQPVVAAGSWGASFAAITSRTAIVSRSVVPSHRHRPCPGARTKLVAPPNLSVSSLQEVVEPFRGNRLALAGLRRNEDLYDIGMIHKRFRPAVGRPTWREASRS